MSVDNCVYLKYLHGRVVRLVKREAEHTRSIEQLAQDNARGEDNNESASGEDEEGNPWAPRTDHHPSDWRGYILEGLDIIVRGGL
ncbi:hypothetical protein Tco_0684979 [Tanacetum coccineum]